MDLGRKFAYLLKIMICSAILSSCTAPGATDAAEKTPSNNKEIITATLDTTSEIQSHSENISLTPNALIDFSKDIDVDSINSKNIILQTSGGKIVPNYKLTVNKNKVVLSVPQKLQPSTKYLIIVSDKITDSSQEHTKTTNFDFTTGTMTFPTAFLIAPDSIDNVSQTPNIEFDFSVPVQNVEAQNVLLEDEAGNIIETSDIISYPFLLRDLELRFYNFFPKIALKPDHNYKILLSSNITDLDGNHLKETTFSFHTGNTIIPEISLKSPTPNEENISQQPTIEFNISATNSDFKNVDSDHIYLLDTADNSNQKIKLHVTKGSHGNNNFIAIVQDPNVHSLVAQRKYNIVFSDEITDSDGNHIVPTSYSFTTGSYITPTVSMLDPVNNAKDVSKTPTIAFMFSGAEGVMHDVDSDNVFLVNDNNPTAAHINLTIVNGSSGVNNYIASLADPKQPLSFSTQYSIVFSKNITDDNEDHIQETRYHFKTGESIFPTAALLNPTDGSKNVSKTPQFQIQFSVPVLHVEKNTTVTLVDSKGRPVEISDLDYFADIVRNGVTYHNVYTFNPIKPLQATTDYKIKLTPGITDEEGQPLKATEFIFTTNSLNIPSVTPMEPNDGDKGVSLSPTIRIRFSTQVQNVTDETLTLHENSETGPIVKTDKPLSSTDNATFTLHPITLKVGTIYYITASSKISSANTDDHLLADKSFHFTTGSNKIIKPELVSPKDNAIGVSIKPKILIHFSAPVQYVSNNPNSVTLNNCKTVLPTNYPINVVPDLSSPSTDYVISAVDNLSPQTKYCVNLKSQIQDELNTPIEGIQFHFTTGEKLVPTVELKSAISDVSINGPVILKFSSPMMTSSQQVEDHISLHMGSATGPKVQLSALVEGNQLYTLSPTSSLNYNTIYYLIIDSSITDTDNNPFPGKQVIIQTMRMSSPTVSIIPGDDNQGDAENTNGVFAVPIHIAFSRPVHSTYRFFGVSSATTIYRDNPSAWDPSIIDVVDKGDGIHFDIYHKHSDLDLGRSYSLKMVFGGYIVDENGLQVADTKIPLNVVRNR